MSRYRLLLQNQAVSDIDCHAEQLPDQADGWLRALSCKYLGALTAADNKTALSRMYFDKAADLLQAYGDDNIIACIRMTVFAEAFRSLGDDSYREKALESLKNLRPVYGSRIDRWNAFLNNNAAFPGLNYWY